MRAARTPTRPARRWANADTPVRAARSTRTRLQNFVTIATPHLGIVRPPSTVFNSVYNFFAARIVSHAGEQMTLADHYQGELPLLAVLATPGTSFMTALAQFQRRGQVLTPTRL